MPRGNEWWREAVIYQVYPRSFADANGDGLGDLPGIKAKLEELAYLGVDAVWLSPFYPSPGNDAGYDVADYCDVAPEFGSLQDFDDLLETAHQLGLKVIVDLVPNHTSDAHRWFQEALAAGPGSEERERYIFREGRGPDQSEPPNNWESVFGGPAWTRLVNEDGSPGQWYLHLFDSSQPDLNWDNPWVREQFEGILRFWLDRGVDGFRVDVAHALDKVDGLPDWNVDADASGVVGEEMECPFFGQPGSHEIYRRWNTVLAEYPGDRVLCAEAWVEPLAKMAQWVRPDEMGQAFNFVFLMTNWDASELRSIIDESLAAFSAVGAPATWVLSNHDTIRHGTRLAITPIPPHGVGVGPRSEGLGSEIEGLRRARAATALMLALPGSAYLYQGEELGLPEVIDLPDEARQDPTWHRNNGEKYGRDGCRVPIPWTAGAPAAGFSPTGQSWLPQPKGWDKYARDLQKGIEGSTLEFYRDLLAIRKRLNLGTQALAWLEGYPQGVLAFQVGEVSVVVNMGSQAIKRPGGKIIAASEPLDANEDTLPADTAVWLTD